MEEKLIAIVQNIMQKYERVEKITQKNFNILISGNIGYKETFHSYLIADLLDPNGMHQQKDLFLQLFLKEILASTKKIQSPSVWAEYVISNDRRIDIAIKDKGIIHIAIEMKVFSKDSKNQLKDYYEYIKKENINAKLYYLTLFGDNVTDESNKDIKYETLSFKNDIYNWLDKCIKEVYDKSNVRESLIIYKNLIEKLTNRNDEKGEEVVELLSKDMEAIKAAGEISENYKKAWAKKEYEFWLDLYAKVDNETSKLWDDGDKIFYNSSYKKSVWYDENDELLEDEKESINRILDIRFGSSHQSHFGISFKKEIKNHTVYCIAGYWNDENSSCWIGIEIKDSNGRICNSKYIKDFFKQENFGLLEEDNCSLYNIVENLSFASNKNFKGTYELFDKNHYKKIINDLAKEMIKIIKKIDKIS